MMVRAVRTMVGNGARGSSECAASRDIVGMILALTAGGGLGQRADRYIQAMNGERRDVCVLRDIAVVYCI
jgi:hypothetical protein